MSVTPHEILQFASELQGTATHELQFRNTIGRAYYSAYHLAEEFHNKLPSQGKDPVASLGRHAELIYRLSNPTIPKTDPRHDASKRLGIKLQGFHRLRITADYQLGATVTDRQSRDSVIKAVEIHNLLLGTTAAP